MDLAHVAGLVVVLLFLLGLIGPLACVCLAQKCSKARSPPPPDGETTTATVTVHPSHLDTPAGGPGYSCQRVCLAPSNPLACNVNGSPTGTHTHPHDAAPVAYGVPCAYTPHPNPTTPNTASTIPLPAVQEVPYYGSPSVPPASIEIDAHPELHTATPPFPTPNGKTGT